MANQIERRVVSGPVETRKTEAGATILEGYAAVFNQETVIGSWFREVIEAGAFKDAIASDDVRALFNHDPNIVLGRTTNNTLALTEDDHGLRYTITLNPNDPDAVRVGAKVERGDVSQSSFAFSMESSDDEAWDFGEKGKLPLRRIRRVSPLYDVSAVTYPAYEGTEVSARTKELAERVPPPSQDAEAQGRAARARKALADASLAEME